MAEPEGNVRILRVIGFAMLGLALVLALVLGADQVAEEDATDVPPWWRGPHEVGVIQSYSNNQLVLMQDDGRPETFVCDQNTRYTARGTPAAPGPGVRCIVIFRNAKPKIAKIVRVLAPAPSASGSPAAAPSPEAGSPLPATGNSASPAVEGSASPSP